MDTMALWGRKSQAVAQNWVQGPAPGRGPGTLAQAQGHGTLDKGQGQGQAPWPMAPRAVLCHSLALGPPYVSILCIHMHPFRVFDSIHVQIEDCELLLGK